MKDERCEGVIKKAWEGRSGGDLVGRLIGKVDDCRVSLQNWSKLSFGNIRRMLPPKKELAQAEAASMAGTNHDMVRTLKGEVYDLMVKKECLWHQRSWTDWLKSGNLNTAYFHSRATQRNKRNFISKLILEEGSVVEEDKKIGEAMVNYFKQLFTSTAPSSFDQILQGIETKVTPSMNVDLTSEFTAEEVEKALKQMKPLTAPELDGMSPIFFKSC